MDEKLRRDRIGGSEIAALYGADDFGKDQFAVWCSKKGAIPPEEPNIRMVMGKALEQGILDIYKHVTGRPVEYHDRTILDPARRYMAATPDAFCTNEKRGVDAKLVFWDQARHWGETADEIPLRVVMQAFWYMAAFDIDLWDICALMIGTGEPRVYTIERDREAERAMLDYVERWHAKYILGDEIPPLGRSAEAARWLQRMYPNDNRPNMREADEAEARLLDQYVEVRLAQRTLKAQQAEMETALKAAIKDHEGLAWAEGKFTWRRTKDGVGVRWEDMALRLLDQFVAGEQERETLLGLYTFPRPGYRKIRIDHPALRKGAKDEEEVTV